MTPQVSPPRCEGQKNTQKYASATETLSAKGGSLCLPVFGDLGGTLPYAAANPSVKMTLTTSTTDYDGKLPTLGSGTAIVYAQFALLGTTKFGESAKGDFEVEGSKISPGKTYSLFGEFEENGSKKKGAPCYAVASKGKYGGVFDGGGSVLSKGLSLSKGAVIIGELYPGTQGSEKCS